jgi:hypothetical protein
MDEYRRDMLFETLSCFKLYVEAQNNFTSVNFKDTGSGLF